MLNILIGIVIYGIIIGILIGIVIYGIILGTLIGIGIYGIVLNNKKPHQGSSPWALTWINLNPNMDK